MTGETKDKTEPWVAQHGMKYAYGYLSKDALGGFMKSLGMGGYPSAALVDPKGTVVWAGHPASLNGGLIEKHLKGADRTPVDVRAVVRKWPDEASAVVSAFRKGKLADALAEADKLTLDPNTVKADVETVIGKAVESLRGKHSAGDYYGFEEAMKEAGKGLAGLEQFVALDELLKEMRRDANAKSIITAQKKLAKLGEKIAEQRKEKDLEKLAEAIDKTAEKFSGTYVETMAKKLKESIDHRKEAVAR